MKCTGRGRTIVNVDLDPIVLQVRGAYGGLGPIFVRACMENQCVFFSGGRCRKLHTKSIRCTLRGASRFALHVLVFSLLTLLPLLTPLTPLRPSRLSHLSQLSRLSQLSQLSCLSRLSRLSRACVVLVLDDPEVPALLQAVGASPQKIPNEICSIGVCTSLFTTCMVFHVRTRIA